LIAAFGSSSCQLFYHHYQLLLLPSASTWHIAREAKKRHFCAKDAAYHGCLEWK